MTTHFQDISAQDLFENGETVWSEEQKKEMNMRIAKARLQYRKSQMQAQRGGQGRYELRKRRLEMKNNHVAQSVDGIQPNDRLDPEQVTNVESNYRAAPDANQAISSKVKRNRAKRAAKKKKKKQKKKTTTTTIEVPGTGTEYDTVKLHLDEESALGGGSDQVTSASQVTKEE